MTFSSTEITAERFAAIFILVVSAIICIALFVVSWGRRKQIGQAVTYFSICVLVAAIYNFGYAMEVNNNTLEGMMFWVRFEQFGIQPLVMPLVT